VDLQFDGQPGAGDVVDQHVQPALGFGAYAPQLVVVQDTEQLVLLAERIPTLASTASAAARASGS
jgi:hypothetical protein